MTINPMSTIIRSATRPQDGPFNILTFVSHERYEPYVCETKHNFYSINRSPDNQVRTWNKQYSPVPDNYQIVDSVPRYVDIDVSLCHNPFVHIPLSYNMYQKSVPIINVFHTMPHPGFSAHDRQQCDNMFNMCDMHVFISDFNRRSWKGFNDNNSMIINHGIDTEFFKPDDSVDRQPILLSVANEYKGRNWALGYHLYHEVVMKGKYKAIHLGTNDFSRPAHDTNELLQFYQNSSIFINTSLHSPIPMSVLEAMSVGCCVISTNTCMIPDIIKHGQNGLLYPPNKPEKFKSLIDLAINEPDMVKELGNKARQTIVDQFNLTTFVDNWSSLFKKILS